MSTARLRRVALCAGFLFLPAADLPAQDVVTDLERQVDPHSRALNFLSALLW